ncbi:nucleoside kinase [[Clostridium] colinum]|uniref:nucleoside kinase n=1 Tax=[Clostridium] colinum TaxID=36835 RepID=UPI002025794E|nr:nucleoside kinase [[Clostridium] colinum]
MNNINVKVVYKNNKILEKNFNKGITLYDIKEQLKDKFDYPIFLAKINNENLELFKDIKEDCEIEFLDITNKHAYLTYKRSVALLMINAIRKILGEDTRIVIKYSINQNWFCEIENVEITEKLLNDISNYMMNTVLKNEKIEKMNVPTNECIKLLNKYKMYDRANGLSFVRKSSINLYKLEDTYDYLYGTMAVDTKDLSGFKIIKNENNSFTLNFLDKNNPSELKEYKNIKKLIEVFEECSSWSKIIGVDYVASLNSAICEGRIEEIILISEALQEKKIANIADMITKNNKKVVLIAGPSSSGKTTFANRICVQLKVNGIKPYVISLDNYYLDRENVPLDEEGKPDFECLESLDVDRINKDMESLINGEPTEIPKFNFLTGKREKGKIITLKENEVIIIEGIHGLNEKISKNIDKKDKFKIFISALTQLNIDSHNRISTTDARIFRRLVRDHYFRGFGVNKTIQIWSDVMKGEVKNIFPFQEEADIIFNSALIYELAVLKPFAEPLLYKVKKDEEEYSEATRLIKFLDSFLPINHLGSIPSNSIIREFIGGSCFEH